MKPIRLASVQLADAAASAPTTWVEVTREGDYKGYPGGAFRFTPEVLGQLVRNFRANPAYRIGPDGTGSADVIPWDFNHASEMPPTSGSVPGMGAPAQAWTQDLDVRMGPDGAELWAKVRWLEPARSYVMNGQYKWASVTVIFDARDPKTGANVGCVLTSIALTNTPFVEGMSELVAASKGGASAPSGSKVRLRWPAGVSRNTPEARALLASLASGSAKLAHDEAAAEIKRYHKGCVDDPADEERVRLAREALRRLPAQLVPGTRVRWPGGVSRKTPEARALIASLVGAGVTVMCDDGFVAKPEQAGVTEQRSAPLDASGATGRNAVERAINAMRLSVPGFAALSWEQQIEQAGKALAACVVAA